MRRTVAVASSCVVLLVGGAVAWADAPPAASVAPTPKPKPKTTWKKPPPEPKLPPPSIEMRIEPRPQRAWILSVVNTGDVPLRIVADARLLRFEIEPPPEPKPEETPAKGKKPKKKTAEKPLECALPGSMRSDARMLVLQPGGRYLEAFDPRLYCLDASKRIVAGTKITARFGWSAGKAKNPAAPFVVTATTPSSSKEIASAKELVAEPVMVTEKSAIVAAITTTTTATTTAATTTKMPLVAHAGTAHSVLRGKDAQVTLHVVNTSTETQRVYARPQLVGARVRSPKGVVTSCDGWARPAPIVDFVVRLKPEAKWSATVTLASICPDGTFDVPGLYEVTPRLHADPIPWEPTAFTGDVVSDTPQLLRIEEGEKPFHELPPFALETSE